MERLLGLEGDAGRMCRAFGRVTVITADNSAIGMEGVDIKELSDHTRNKNSSFALGELMASAVALDG